MESYWKEMKSRIRLWWFRYIVLIIVIVLAIAIFLVTSMFSVKPIYGAGSDAASEVEYTLPVTWQGSDNLAGCEMTAFVSIGEKNFGKRAVRLDIAITMKAKTKAHAVFAIRHANTGRDPFCSFFDVKNNDLTDDFSVKLKGGDAKTGKCVQLVINSNKTYEHDYQGIITFQGILSEASIEEGLAAFAWELASSDAGNGELVLSSQALQSSQLVE